MILGGLSGGLGPLVNNPLGKFIVVVMMGNSPRHCYTYFGDFSYLAFTPPNHFQSMCTDVVKTRQQKQVVVEGIAPKYHGVLQSCILIAQEEGIIALWKGIGSHNARPGYHVCHV